MPQETTSAPTRAQDPTDPAELRRRILYHWDIDKIRTSTGREPDGTITAIVVTEDHRIMRRPWGKAPAEEPA